MELIVGLFLLIALFVGALLLVDYVFRAGGTMQERKAVVFEVYRYAVCFVMLIVFGLMGFQLISGLMSENSSPGVLSGPALGVLISGLLFITHWLLKNPSERTTAIAPEASSSDTPS